MSRVLLFAPSVHVGGGAVLLRALLQAWAGTRPLVAWLDSRARATLPLPVGMQVHWVEPTLHDRWSAEHSMRRLAQPGDHLLCFHGLPPLFRSQARVSVFQQNRIHLGGVSLRQYALRTRLRLWLEQRIVQGCRSHVDAYWVQTSSMARALREWWGEGPMPPVHVLGFASGEPLQMEGETGERFDFVYVADGVAHKNHRRLVEAWTLLAQRGVRPSLALTLTPRDALLRGWVQEQTVKHGLRIHHLASLDHAQVMALYRRCGALVFPSVSESYGLPLIEARQAGLPIVASELDFVRDVCEPVQTFDPQSATSLARAVLRHLGKAEAPPLPAGAREFWSALLATP